ncbi:MAG: PAS domain S-box protein [Paludibacter sp.]
MNELFNNEKLHQSILEAAINGFLVVDINGNIKEANQSYSRMSGYSIEELIVMNLYDIEAPKSNPEVDTTSIKQQKDNKNRFETKHRRKDGSLFDVEISVHYNSIDKEGFIIAFVDDITLRKSYEKELIKSLTDYKDVFLNAPIGYHEIDMDGRVVRMNKTELDMLGYTYDEVKGRFIWEFVNHGEFSEQNTRSKLQQTIELDATPFEREFLRKDNLIIDVLITDKYILSADGEVIGIRSAVQDITQRKRTEAEVVRLGKHYQAIIEKSPDGFVLLNKKGDPNYASPSALRMFGYELDEFIALKSNTLTHPNELSIVTNCLMEILKNPAHIPTIEYRFKHKNGDWIWIESTISNLLADRNVESILINFRNINDRKLTEISLKESKDKLNMAEFASKSGNWEFFSETNSIKLSEGAVRIFGLDYDQFDNVEVTKFVLPEYHTLIEDTLKNLIERNEPYDIEFKINTADTGELKTLHSAAIYSIKTKSVFGIIRDVSDRKKTEEALMNSEKIQQTILQTAINGFCILDTKGRFVECNESYSRMTGYTTHELLKMSITDIKVHESVDNAKDNFKEIIKTGFNRFETRHRCKDGSIIDVDINAQLKKFNKTDLIVAFIANITDRKRNEKKIEENTALLNKLLISSTEFIEFKQEVDYKKLLETVTEISGAKFGSYNLLSDNHKDFKTVAVTGIDKLQKSVKSIIGFELIGKEWKYDANKVSKIKNAVITKFDTLVELSGNVMPKSLVSLVSKMFNIGEVWIIQIKNGDIVMGDFTLLFSKNTTLQNPKILELYSKQIALLIERLKAKEALIESENKYRLLFESNPMPMSIFDSETLEFLSVNKAFVDKYGFSEEEFSHMTILDIRPKEEFDKLKQSVKSTDKGVRNAAVFIHKKKNNELINVEIFRHEINYNGRNAKLVLANDVTERIKAENALHESEIFFRQSQHAANIGSYILTVETGTWTSSEVLDEIFGIDDKYERNLDKWLELVHPDDRAMMDDYLTNYVIAERQRFNKEFRIVRKSDKKTIWVLCLGELLIVDGKILSMTGTVLDITDRKKAEELLVERTDFIEKLIDLNPGMVYIYDLVDRKDVYTNHGINRALGYSEDEISEMGDKLLPTLMHPDDFKEYVANIVPLYSEATNNEQITYQCRMKRKDGSWCWIEALEVVYLRNKDQKPLQILGLGIDITKRKTSEQELMRYENLLSDTEKLGNVGGWEFDIETRKLLWTKQVYAIHEVPDDYVPTIEAAIGFYTPESAVIISEAVQNAIEKNQPFDLELEVLTAKGNLRKVHSIGMADATTGRVFGYFQDITEQKRIEKNLRESELFFRQSQKAGRIGSYNLNLEAGMWNSSEVLDEIFGIDKQYERSIGGWSELVYEEDRDMMNDYFANQVLGQRQRFNKEYRIKRKSDGKVSWVLGLGELIVENDVVKAMVGTIQDINDRKLIEHELHQKMSQLVRFQNVTVGRELTMINLKKEINELRAKIGEEPKYTIID